MKKQFPTISAVSVRPSGGVQLYDSDGHEAPLRRGSTSRDLSRYVQQHPAKWVIVVDPDINVHDAAEVEWAISYRTVPGRDVILVKDVPSAPLDPSSTGGEVLQARLNDSIGIDATMPFGEDYAVVADVPGWAGI